MVSKELEDVVLVPDVNAVFLLVAGRTEGGARPLGFREERVIAQCPWWTEMLVLVQSHTGAEVWSLKEYSNS